ncbi:GNAT family N-acetyltransferase [Pseudoflavonifractor sp. 60]|uniref:GNAT family N-acetyltransferase n=1 Tax=Pseudoflavonifractor sp. 60 TaxID=2304576 RepID=UPI00136A7739|nr:GNAT family N-acetyltransferase [Pseudoflavonifractor sp. 60]NBI67773.1 GNAT family N-acetyltransferase [Pseudoflavonifractor sp. 60]
MVTVRPSVFEDVPTQRELWKLAFGDSDAYIDNFYRTYYRPERVVVLEEEGAVCSMTAWFDTTFVVPGQGEYRAAYLYAVATHPDCRGRGLAGELLAGADEFFRGLGIPAVTTVPAEPSLHNFFGANGFRECFRVLESYQYREELEKLSPANALRPASVEEYGQVREQLLADIPHIAYPEDALAYQAGCCALGDGGLFVGDTPAGPMCLCAERADGELVMMKEFLCPRQRSLQDMARIWLDFQRIAPARRWQVRQPRSLEWSVGVNEDLGKFAMLKWLDSAMEKSWNWDTVGYLGLAFD